MRKQEVAIVGFLLPLIIAAVFARSAIRQDNAVTSAAEVGFEAISSTPNVHASLIERYGSCAVAELEWRGGLAFVGLMHQDRRWAFKGVIEDRSDADDVGDRADCLDAVASTGSQ